MSPFRKIISSSLLSLFLVIWGLFMVCSGRVPDLQTEDDWLTTEENYDEEYKSDLMKELASLDENATELEAEQRREILQALGIEPDATVNTKAEEEVLTEDAFTDMEKEVAELEQLNQAKSVLIDSLKLEDQEANHQLAALDNLVNQSTTSSSLYANGLNRAGSYGSEYGTSEYAMAYQAALDEVYDRNYSGAIDKFRRLLRQSVNDDLSDNAQYWIGECYYALGQYQVAITEFEKVFSYDKNNKQDDAQFMIGMAYLKVGQRELAELELNTLLEFYSNSEYASRAETRLTEINI